MISVRELERLRAEARRLAESVGLDPFPVVFGVLDYEEINEIAAYEGFPVRYPHWRFGMGYDAQRKRAAYQGAWVFELVINADPALAYLRRSNTPLEHKAVMVHVYAHADFFKHNRWFAHTLRDALRVMERHARRIEDYRQRHGVETVESFMDKAFSLQYNVDPHAPFLGRHGPAAVGDAEPDDDRLPVRRAYMDRFINPPDWMDRRRQRRADEARRARERRLERLELARPDKDLLGYLVAHARLEDWQLDILAMLREEALYFVPQMQTKVMNEGWAAYWQSELMKDFADPDEFLDHAEMQSLVLGGGGGLNPYKLGKLIWEDIRRRWDRGRFGRAWEACDRAEARDHWDTGAGLGLEKMFEVRAHANDLTFLTEYFTEDLFQRLDLFSYEYVPETGQYHVTSQDFQTVKAKLLMQFTNLGRPTIKVATGNHDNRGELLLLHEWNGVPLALDEARLVLNNLYALWRRPVNLKTIRWRKGRDPNPLRQRVRPELPQTATVEEQGMLLRYDGERVRELALSDDEVADLRVDAVDYRTLPQEWMG